jgi:biopolymer transport protein ExbD
MAFQPSKSKRHDTRTQGTLNMNSMMDMMTIILLFLLKSYSTEGALASQSESLKLPVSERTVKPKKELNVSVATDVILVNEIPLMPARDIDPNEFMIAQLEAKLIEYGNRERQMEIETGKEFTHEVIIQGDKSIPFETLFKVMYTCSKSDFYKMRLLTVQSSKVE